MPARVYSSMKLFDKFLRRSIFENLKAPCKKERKNGIESQKEDHYRRGGGGGTRYRRRHQRGCKPQRRARGCNRQARNQTRTETDRDRIGRGATNTLYQAYERGSGPY